MKPSRREILLALVRRRGLPVTQSGQAVRVIGPGVNVMASDLRDIDPHDLLPPKTDYLKRLKG